mgnify:CR=1 FL=1
MNINKLREEMNNFLEQLEKELLEELCSVKPFNDATKEEIKEYLDLHCDNKINLSDYWNVGDKRVEADGATYVIIDITKDNVVVMRTDLVGLNSRMNMLDFSHEYEGSDAEIYLNKLCSYILGDTFCELAKPRIIRDCFNSSFKHLVWLPSASEVFGNEALDKVRKDGEQFKFFKKKENRVLDASWWTRSGYWDSSYARFVFCYTDGSQYKGYAHNSYGLAPCFYI